MWKLPDDSITTNEVGFYLPTAFIPPNTLRHLSVEQLAEYGITPYAPPSDPEPIVDLDALRAGVLSSIDAQAETERLKYITAGAGMAVTYQEKLAQARAALADANRTPGEYPLLEASVGIEADTVEDVASLVVARYNQWVLIGAAIEATRLGAKKAASDAQTAEEIRAAGSPTWPAP